MREQEAIDIINQEIKCVTNLKCDRNCGNCDLAMDSSEKIVEAYKLAIEALKKRIPMQMPGTYTDYKCAVCGRRIRSGKGSSSFKSRDYYCQRCGQMIDWEEDDILGL